MTLTKPKTSLDTVGKKEPEPAKRWRNLWEVAIAFFNVDDGKEFDVGQRYWGTRVYPSRDAAETAAAKYNPDPLLFVEGKPSSRHVGAFPLPDSDQ